MSGDTAPKEQLVGWYRPMLRELVDAAGERLGEVVKVEMGPQTFDWDLGHNVQRTHLTVRTADGVLWKDSFVDLTGGGEVEVRMVRKYPPGCQPD